MLGCFLSRTSQHSEYKKKEKYLKTHTHKCISSNPNLQLTGARVACFFPPKPGFSPFPPLLISCFLYLLSKSFGWFLLSRFLSMRSDRSCLRTPVAYSISPCSAVMMREATLPLSRIEKDLCASNVRMKVNRKCFLVSSWPNNVRAFSTLAGT